MTTTSVAHDGGTRLRVVVRQWADYQWADYRAKSPYFARAAL
ncbi:hypothetical protein [Sinomonas sp. P10A9]|uniref:Uncharacterized protein n=1 Tax=Sinomonas puerhi TaxID=3238584 RepID=A0AB39L3Z9_9MICC